MSKASSPSEVIDLCSDDEDEFKVGNPSTTTKKRGRESSSSLFGADGQGVSNKKTSGSKGRMTQENRISSSKGGPVSTNAPPSAQGGPPKASCTCSIHEFAPIVLDEDDDGNDNAVITYGIMKFVNGVNTVPQASTCASVSQRESCVSTLEHIQQNDKWSCGYRNLQMMLTAILPHLPASHAYYHIVPRRLHAITIPTLQQLQHGLEQSWKAGFDAKGAQHYQQKIEGKKAKIGAVEVASLLSYWGVDATVVQFIQCRESRVLLSKFVKAYFSKKLGKGSCPFCRPLAMTTEARVTELLQCAESDADIDLDASCDCPCLPLYLQWEGHSVTIAGIERTRPSSDVRFLVLDPLKQGGTIKTMLEHKKSLEPLWFSSKQLLHKDVQVIMCSLRPLSHSEKGARREQVSAVTAARDAVMRVAAP